MDGSNGETSILLDLFGENEEDLRSLFVRKRLGRKRWLVMMRILRGVEVILSAQLREDTH